MLYKPFGHESVAFGLNLAYLLKSLVNRVTKTSSPYRQMSAGETRHRWPPTKRRCLHQTARWSTWLLSNNSTHVPDVTITSTYIYKASTLWIFPSNLNSYQQMSFVTQWETNIVQSFETIRGKKVTTYRLSVRDFTTKGTKAEGGLDLNWVFRRWPLRHQAKLPIDLVPKNITRKKTWITRSKIGVVVAESTTSECYEENGTIRKGARFKRPSKTTIGVCEIDDVSLSLLIWRNAKAQDNSSAE